MITLQLAAKLEAYTTWYVDTLYGNNYMILEELQSKFIGDDESFSVKHDYNKLWEALYPIFHREYDIYKTGLFECFSELQNAKWDGEESFYHAMWSKYISIHGGYESSNGESAEGGSYTFTLYDNVPASNVSFFKTSSGVSLIVREPNLEWDSFASS